MGRMLLILRPPSAFQAQLTLGLVFVGDSQTAFNGVRVVVATVPSGLSAVRTVASPGSWSPHSRMRNWNRSVRSAAIRYARQGASSNARS